MKMSEIFNNVFFNYLTQQFAGTISSLLYPYDLNAAMLVKYGSWEVSETITEIYHRPDSEGGGELGIALLISGIYNESWERIGDSLMKIYNPAENYSRLEIDTVQRDKGTETTTTTPTGSFTTTSETKTAPYNDGYKDYQKLTTTQTPGPGAKSESKTEHTTVSRSYDGETLTGDELEIHKNITTGNIGVKTSAEMITEEIAMRVKNIFTYQVLADIVSFAGVGVSEVDI